MAERQPPPEPASLQEVARRFFFPGGQYERALESQTMSACLATDLELDEVGRVQLCMAFEQRYDIRVSEHIVWHESTTLEILYDDVEKQLKKKGVTVPRTLPTDNDLHKFFDREMERLMKDMGPRLVFCFSGQGAQKLGMGVADAMKSPICASYFQVAEKILGYDLLDIIKNGPQERLDSTVVCQPAMFVINMIALQRLKETDPTKIDQCVVCAGLSLGEYSALVFAEAISFEDALSVVKVRAEAMQAASELQKTGMVSLLGLSEQQVIGVVEDVNKDHGKTDENNKHTAAISNFLAPGNYVVGASEELLPIIEKHALGRQFLAKKAKRLAVSAAFHTTYMESAQPALKEALKKIEIRMPRISVFSNVTGKPFESVEEIRGNLVRHVAEPVLWQQSMATLVRENHTEFVELGCGSVLTGLMRHNVRVIINHKQIKLTNACVSETLSASSAAPASGQNQEPDDNIDDADDDDVEDKKIAANQ